MRDRKDLVQAKNTGPWLVHGSYRMTIERAQKKAADLNSQSTPSLQSPTKSTKINNPNATINHPYPRYSRLRPEEYRAIRAFASLKSAFYTWDNEMEIVTEQSLTSSVLQSRDGDKKVRLFGFVLNPRVKDDESRISSVTIVSEEEDESIETKMYSCQLCLKKFVTSLHRHWEVIKMPIKRRRLRKKRIQIQARKASFNIYLHSLLRQNGFFSQISFVPTDCYQNLDFNTNHISYSPFYASKKKCQ